MRNQVICQQTKDRSARLLPLLASLLVIAATALGGCRTSAPKQAGSDPGALATKLSQPRTLKVDALALDSQTGKGVVTQLSVMVGPNAEGGLDVSVVGAAPGSRLQATLWVAAHVAAGMVGRPLEEYSIKLTSARPVGGAELGATLVSALVAAMRGTPVDPQAAATGSLLMSRSLGPVVGLPQLLAAAAGAGKKVFGYPVGQRQATDLTTGDKVDLQVQATKHGIKLVELRSAFDAFAVLTGKQLDQPKAIALEGMKLAEAERRQILVASRDIIDQAAKLHEKTLKDAAGAADAYLPKQSQAHLAQQNQVAAQAIAKARSWWTQRRAVEAFESANQAREATQWGRAYLAIVAKPGSTEAEPFGRGAVALKDIREKITGEISFRRFRFEQSLNHAVWDIAVYQRLIVALLRSAWSQQRLAEAQVLVRGLDREWLSNDGAAEKAAQLDSLLVNAALHGSVAWAELRTAQDLGKLQVADTSGAVVYDETALRDLSLTFLNTAQVVLQYYRDVVKPARGSAPAGLPELVLEQQAAGVQSIPDQVIAKKWGAESAPTSIVRLAGAKEALISAALLLDHAVSSGQGQAAVRQARLDNARRTALQLALLAKTALGQVPMSARLAFQLAKAREATGDLAGAQKGYWRSGMESDEAVVLARTAKKDDKSQ